MGNEAVIACCCGPVVPTNCIEFAPICFGTANPNEWPKYCDVQLITEYTKSVYLILPDKCCPLDVVKVSYLALSARFRNDILPGGFQSWILEPGSIRGNYIHTFYQYQDISGRNPCAPSLCTISTYEVTDLAGEAAMRCYQCGDAGDIAPACGPGVGWEYEFFMYGTEQISAQYNPACCFVPGGCPPFSYSVPVNDVRVSLRLGGCDGQQGACKQWEAGYNEFESVCVPGIWSGSNVPDNLTPIGNFEHDETCAVINQLYPYRIVESNTADYSLSFVDA